MANRPNRPLKAMKKLLLLSAIVLVTAAAQAQRPTCKGTTKAGQPCKSTIVLKSGYCRSHDPNQPKCAFIKADKTRCKIAVNKAGELCHVHQPIKKA
jgi:hypothetical protein